MNTTIELHGAQTGNSIRAAIALEEAGLLYTSKLVDLFSGAHQGADHLALNPLGKVPVLVEKQEGREPFISYAIERNHFVCRWKITGSIILGDVAERTGVLAAACTRCGRTGRHGELAVLVR